MLRHRPQTAIPTGRRKGHNPSLSSIYRALAEHEKTQAYPEAVETAHADFAALQQRDRSPVTQRYSPPGGSYTRTGPYRTRRQPFSSGG